MKWRAQEYRHVMLIHMQIDLPARLASIHQWTYRQLENIDGQTIVWFIWFSSPMLGDLVIFNKWDSKLCIYISTTYVNCSAFPAIIETKRISQDAYTKWLPLASILIYIFLKIIFCILIKVSPEIVLVPTGPTGNRLDIGLATRKLLYNGVSVQLRIYASWGLNGNK